MAGNPPYDETAGFSAGDAFSDSTNGIYKPDREHEQLFINNFNRQLNSTGIIVMRGSLNTVSNIFLTELAKLTWQVKDICFIYILIPVPWVMTTNAG